MATQTVTSIEDAETKLRAWLETMSGGLPAMQPGDEPDIKRRHFLYQLVNVSAPISVTSLYESDAEGTRHCVLTDMTLTYQVEAAYCTDSASMLTRVIALFSTGQYRKHGDFENFAFTQANGITRLSTWKNTRRHYRATVDLDFAYKERVCEEVNTIDSFTIHPCVELSDTFPAVEAART